MPAIAPVPRALVDDEVVDAREAGFVWTAMREVGPADAVVEVVLNEVVDAGKREESVDCHSTVMGWAHMVNGPDTVVELRSSSLERAWTCVVELLGKVEMQPSKITEDVPKLLMCVKTVV